MNANWPVVKLGDYCTKIGSGSTPRGGASVYLDKGEISLIRSQNIYNDGFNTNGLVYITEESAAKLKNVIIESGDVLINITGDSVARVCMAPDKYLPARVNQHVAIIRPKSNEFDARYIRYLLTSPAMQSYLLTIASVGATRNALTKGMIETLEVTKPPLSVQKSIADKLEALENKILVNTEINQTLEQIAQAIFKSWFVDFEPVKAKIAAREALLAHNPTATAEQIAQAEQQAAIKATSGDVNGFTSVVGDRTSGTTSGDVVLTEQLQTLADLFPNQIVESELGEIPEGWEVKSAEQVFDITIGKTPPRKEPQWFSNSSIDMKWLSIKDMGDEGSFAVKTSERLTHEAVKKHNIKVVPRGTVLLSFKLTLGRVSITTEDMCTNEAIAHFRVNDKTPSSEWTYCFLKQYPFESLGSTSSIAKAVNSKIIKAMPCLFANEVLINEFSSLVSSLFNKIELTIHESNSLCDVRDTLLPKLLSGEIELTNMEVA